MTATCRCRRSCGSAARPSAGARSAWPPRAGRGSPMSTAGGEREGGGGATSAVGGAVGIPERAGTARTAERTRHFPSGAGTRSREAATQAPRWRLASRSCHRSRPPCQWCQPRSSLFLLHYLPLLLQRCRHYHPRLRTSSRHPSSRRRRARPAYPSWKATKRARSDGPALSPGCIPSPGHPPPSARRPGMGHRHKGSCRQHLLHQGKGGR